MARRVRILHSEREKTSGRTKSHPYHIRGGYAIIQVSDDLVEALNEGNPDGKPLFATLRTFTVHRPAYITKIPTQPLATRSLRELTVHLTTPDIPYVIRLLQNAPDLRILSFVRAYCRPHDREDAELHDQDLLVAMAAHSNLRKLELNDYILCPGMFWAKGRVHSLS